jgi:hypothetical protein
MIYMKFSLHFTQATLRFVSFSLIINILLRPTYISSNIYCNFLANIDMWFVYGDFKEVE